MLRPRRFNPGALHDLDRATVAQVIVPGSTAYDWTHKGGQGNIVPAVGDYPSGSPNGHWGGLSEWLGDDAAAPLSPPMAAVLIVGSALGLWWLAYFSKGGRK